MTSLGNPFNLIMAAWICYPRCWCWNRTGFNTGHVQLTNLPTVKLDTSHMGNNVVIVKNGRRICGSGAALANAPIVQNKGFFEIKIQSSGIWGVGVSTRKANLNTVPLGEDAESWVLRHDGLIFHNNEQIGKLPELPEEGDIIGMTYDHFEFHFYLNGKNLESPITGIRGTIFPVFYVDEGAIIDVQFTGFYHPPPDGFEEIMIEKSLL